MKKGRGRTETPKYRKWSRGGWRTIEQAYITRDDSPSLVELSREFGLSERVLAEYSSRENWVAKRTIYWRKISIKVQDNLSDEEAKRLVASRAIVDNAIADWVRQVRAKKIFGSFGDIDKLLRLREFLHGKPDGRLEVSLNEYEQFIKALEAKRNEALTKGQVTNIIDAEILPEIPKLPAPVEGAK